MRKMPEMSTPAMVMADMAPLSKGKAYMVRRVTGEGIQRPQQAILKSRSTASHPRGAHGRRRVGMYRRQTAT